MLAKRRFLKEIIWLLLIVCAADNVHPESAESSEEDSSIEVNVESTPYTLKFSLVDTEHYELESVVCEPKKNTDSNVESHEFMCDNLNPCSTYTAILTITVLATNTTSTTRKTAQTEYIAPTTRIVKVESGVEEIRLTWASTDRTCITGFSVEAKSEEKDFRVGIADPQQSETLIKDLSPCMFYNITLKTDDINKKEISVCTSNTTTLYAEPGNVTVKFEAYDNAQMKVSWDPPYAKWCVKYYYVDWFQVGCTEAGITQRTANGSTNSNFFSSDSDETDIPTDKDCKSSANITDSLAKDYVLSGLQGCEHYGFKIYINNNDTVKGEGEFYSPEQVPGKVVPDTHKVDSTSITLFWKAPKTNPKCVKNYEVAVSGPLQRIEELQIQYYNLTNNLNYTYNNLDPCGQYNFTIRAKSLNGTKGKELWTMLEINEAKPSQVLHATVTPYPYALAIEWEPPTFGDLCLEHYRLTGWKEENDQISAFDETTSALSVHIEGLYSCQSYTIQIIAVTKSSLDGDPARIETVTKAIIPQAPYNFQATAIYPHSIELSAMDSDLNNTCEIIYAHFACQLSKPVDVPHKSAEKYVEGQVAEISFKALLAPLSPFTDYKCTVALLNVAGWSKAVPLIATTGAYFPDPPEDLNQKSSTNSTVNFTWKAPKYANGNIQLYKLHFLRVDAAYYVPPLCGVISADPKSSETSGLQQSFERLSAYTKYSIQVAARNEYGVGEYTKPFMGTTESWVSEPVTDLLAIPEGPYASELEYKANVVVTFLLPCVSNGKIEFFQLEFTGDRKNNEKQQFHRLLPPTYNESGHLVYNETDLRPEYNYTVSVAVKVAGVQETSPLQTEVFEAPAGIPKKLNKTLAAQSTVDAFAASNPTNSAIVRFPATILESEAGSVMYIALLLSEKGCNEVPTLRFGALNTEKDWPESSSWYEVYKENTTNCINQYQTTPLRWQPRSAIERAAGTNDIIYVIGEDQCDSSSQVYCNGPLKADTEYHLVIRLFTKSGYNDALTLEFRTDSLIQLTLILISVSTCLLLALIIGIIYLWIRKRLNERRESYQGIEDVFGDISAKNFSISYREISKPEKLNREFKELTAVAMDLSYSASELGCSKNRYADIFPYDKNRVILDIDADGSDYINASFIDGYRRKKEYIATQGPKPESTVDFWRMVLQHNVRVIVMVTQFREGDQIKCHEYFPFTSKSINVSIKKKDVFDLYDRTEMTVLHNNYGLKQKVVHFYFKMWPDHGCPTDPMHLITFVRKVKAEKVPSFSPIIVHCSAGVGRSGTFIGLDIIMQRLKNESKISIYETVKKLRFQRMKMVQTITQYTFLYTCAYELVKGKDSCMTQKLKDMKGKTPMLHSNGGAVVHNDLEKNDVSKLNCNDLPNGGDKNLLGLHSEPNAGSLVRNNSAESDM